MRKILSGLLLIALTTAVGLCETILPKGSIIQAYLKKPISTGLNQEGDIVYFVSPSDVFSGEENVFPKNTIFIGKIDFLKMPVQGVNGAFKVKITNVFLPDGKKRTIDASLYYKSSTTVGGGLTPPSSYKYAVHPAKGQYMMSGVLQYVPSGKYEFGKDTTITTREPVFLLLNEDYVSW